MKVKLSVYTSYLKAIGLPPGLAVIFLAIVAKCMDLGASFWLSRWSDEMGEYEKQLLAAENSIGNITVNSTLDRSENLDQGFYLGIYAVLGFFQGL